jgi:hypothetical protein
MTGRRARDVRGVDVPGNVPAESLRVVSVVCAKEIVAAVDRATATAIPRSLFMRHLKLVRDGRTDVGR